MGVLTKKELLDVANWPGDCFASLYMPEENVGAAKMANQIRFKNLLKQAEDGLRERGRSPAEVQRMIEPARALFNQPQILRSINGMSFVVGFNQSHRQTVFQQPQHVDRLSLLEWRLTKSRKFTEHLTAKWNHTDLLEYRLLSFCKINGGNRRAREIERLTMAIHHHFDGVPIKILIMLRYAMHQINATDGAILGHRS